MNCEPFNSAVGLKCCESKNRIFAIYQKGFVDQGYRHPKQGKSKAEGIFGGVKLGPHPQSSMKMPILSMYGVFTYIWLIFMVNVGKYTMHGWYGIYIYSAYVFICYNSLKLTFSPLKIGRAFKRNFIFQPSIFRCCIVFVSGEGNVFLPGVFWGSWAVWLAVYRRSLRPS